MKQKHKRKIEVTRSHALHYYCVSRFYKPLATASKGALTKYNFDACVKSPCRECGIVIKPGTQEPGF